MPYQSELYFQSYQAEDLNRVPLVLIHGAGGEHLSWPSQLRRLAGYRVYTPDLPGHGKSKGPGLQRVPAYADRILEWVKALELPRFFLAGHSMGGAIALTLALDHPELLHGLALVSTGAQLPVNLSLIEELATPQGFPAAVENICRWSLGRGAEPAVAEGVRKALLETRPSVLASDFRACDAYNLSGRLGSLELPTLVLVGEEDRMTPLRFSQELQESIPGAVLEVLPGAGHMLPLEKPLETAAALRGFLEQVRGS